VIVVLDLTLIGTPIAIHKVTVVTGKTEDFAVSTNLITTSRRENKSDLTLANSNAPKFKVP
jgi:hypothetical protein